MRNTPTPATPAGRDATSLVIGLLLAAFCAYALAFILATSFVIDGQRYFCLFDDAMVSMRYARNLANDQGLVWNAGGERVEGFTNPLWVFYMAGLHLLPLAGSKVSLLVQLTGAACLALNLVFVGRIGRLIWPDSRWAWLGPAVLSAFYLPLNTWGLLGMEVGPLVLIVSACTLTALRSISGSRFSWPLYLLMGVALLIRMDMLIPCAVICGFLGLVDKPNRLRNWGVGFAVLGGVLLLQTACRFVYYGELLPNTYYVKMTGYPTLARISHGLWAFMRFAWSTNLALFLLPMSILLVRRDKNVMLLLLVFLGQAAYGVYVGGDAWEHYGGGNRYTAVAMPLFFILLCASAIEIGKQLFPSPSGKAAGGEGLSSDGLNKKNGRRPALAMTAFVLVALVTVNFQQGPKGLARLVLIERPMHVFANQLLVEQSLALSAITRPDAKVALVTAGVIPYFADRPSVDLLGKNDLKLAREPMHGASGGWLRRATWFYPGHLKWDYDYSIGQLEPDVVAHLWRNSEDASKYLRDHYRCVRLGRFTFFVRTGSPKIRWDQFEELGATERSVDDAIAAEAIVITG